MPQTGVVMLNDLDLYNCPVTEVDGYRQSIFDMLGNLKYLDGFDACAATSLHPGPHAHALRPTARVQIPASALAQLRHLRSERRQRQPQRQRNAAHRRARGYVPDHIRIRVAILPLQ